MRIVVIGPGALGIVTAIRLGGAGHEVYVAVRDENKAARLGTAALRMTGPDGAVIERNIPCIHSPDQVANVDALIHTTKCHVAADVLAKWLPCLATDGVVIPFQNGVMGDEMAAIAGDHYLECSVYWPATLLDEGHSHMTANGQMRVGEWPHGNAGPTSRAAAVAKVLSAVVPTQPHPDMRAVKWSKLVANSAMSSLGVVTGEAMAGMMEHKPTRDAFLDIVAEGIAVMEAQGMRYVQVANAKANLLKMLPRPIAHVALKALTRKYRHYRSSSAQSLARGAKTEVDYLNGLIVQAGGAHGVPTPVNEAVVAAVHNIEAGERAAGPLDLHWPRQPVVA